MLFIHNQSQISGITKQKRCDMKVILTLPGKNVNVRCVLTVDYVYAIQQNFRGSDEWEFVEPHDEYVSQEKAVLMTIRLNKINNEL